MNEKEKLLKLAEFINDMADRMIVIELQVMSLENNQQLLLKKLKEAKKKKGN